MRPTGAPGAAAARIAALVLAAAALGQTARPPAGAPTPTRLKTIGVVGGIGPQATMDFETRLHRAAQRRLPQLANTG